MPNNDVHGSTSLSRRSTSEQGAAQKAPFSSDSEICSELSSLILQTPELQFSQLSGEQLVSHRKRVETLCSSFKDKSLSQAPALAGYRNALLREIRRRKSARLKKTLPKITLSLLVLGLLSGTTYLCRDRAEQLEQELSAALEEQRWERTKAVVQVVNTPFNRLLYPRLENTIFSANQWITSINNICTRLDRHIKHVEDGSIAISAMQLSHRAQIERDLRALPPELSPRYKSRWLQLINKEKQALDQQQQTLLSELQAPLPPFPELRNELEADKTMLSKQLSVMQERRRTFYYAIESYDLPVDLLHPLDNRINTLREFLIEVNSLISLRESLAHCRTYEQHFKNLHNFRAAKYEPAAALCRLAGQLPAEEQVKVFLNHTAERITDPEQLEAALHTHLQGSATFTAQYPATTEQLHLMEDLFSAPTLYTPLFELIHENGEICYSENKPQMDEQRRLHFRRSSLDPRATLHNRQICWDDPTCVSMRLLSPRYLMEHLGIDRSDFFREKNVPELLGQVLNFSHKNCPALAQAFVYYRLLRLLDVHSYPLMSGVRYSPTMRKHAASFKKVALRHELPLRAGCWLGNTPAQQAAERDFRKWFNEHKGTDYSAEIRQNIAPLMKTGILYCGFIDEQGRTILFRSLKEDKAIWYMSKGAFTTSPAGTPPEEADVFSPVFTTR